MALEMHFVLINRATGLADMEPYFVNGQWARDNCEHWKWACDLAGEKAIATGEAVHIRYADGPIVGGIVPPPR